MGDFIITLLCLAVLLPALIWLEMHRRKQDRANARKEGAIEERKRHLEGRWLQEEKELHEKMLAAVQNGDWVQADRLHAYLGHLSELRWGK